MKKKHMYRCDYLGFNTDKLKLIGQGHQGRVYLLPNDRVLKVFNNTDTCGKQLEILLKVQESRFFPTVYEFDSKCIIMSFVYGSTLSYYLRQNILSKALALELVKLIDELKKFNFTRVDARLGHIYLQPDDTIKVIDPRGSFEKIQPYPKSMLKGLNHNGDLRDFFDFIKNDYPHYYEEWRKLLARDLKY